MRPGIARIDTVIFKQDRLVVAAHPGRGGDGRADAHADLSAALLGRQHQRLVPMLLRAQGAGQFHAAVHHPAALIVETQDGGDHIGTALRGFQGGGTLRLIADPARRRSLTRGKARRKNQAGRIPTASAVRAGESRRYPFRRKHTALLGIPAVETVIRQRHKGLLFHPRLGAQGRGHITEIPHLISLVGGKGCASCFLCIQTVRPACISSASLSWGGSALPLASARLKIPKQAVLLK